MVHQTIQGTNIHTNTAIAYLRTALRIAKVRFDEHKSKMRTEHVININDLFTCSERDSRTDTGLWLRKTQAYIRYQGFKATLAGAQTDHL